MDDTGETKEKQSLVRDFWKKKIGSFIDAREFFRQRSEILKSPEMMLAPPETDTDKWKSPLTFAMQSILLQLMLFSAVGQIFVYCPHTMQSVFHLTRTKPELEVDKILNRQFNQVRDTERVISEVRHAQPAMTFYFEPYRERLTRNSTVAPLLDEAPHPRDEFVRMLTAINAQQKAQFAMEHAVARLDHSISKLTKEWSGLIIVLMAEVFRRLVTFGRFRATRNVDQSDTIFLYYFTAVTFWMNVILKVVGSLEIELQRYGASVAAHNFAVGVCVLVYVIGWTYALFRSIPVLIKLLGFGGEAVPTRATRLKVGADVFVTVVSSQVLAVLILFVAFLVLDKLQALAISLRL